MPFYQHVVTGVKSAETVYYPHSVSISSSLTSKIHVHLSTYVAKSP